MTAAKKKNSSTKSNFALLFCFDLLRLHRAIFLPCNAAPSLPRSLCVAHGQQNLAIKDESIVHIDDDIAVMGMKLLLLIWMKIVLTQAQ
jgi:hypothetical protein